MDPQKDLLAKLAQAQELLAQIAEQIFAKEKVRPVEEEVRPVPPQMVPETQAKPTVPAPQQSASPIEQTDPAHLGVEPLGLRPEKVVESSVGLVGTFDGEFVLMPNGKKFQVPPNYVSKSMLITGDQLKLMREGDFNEFKLIKQVERAEREGILTKKDNQWVALVEGHEYRLVSASIRYYNGEFGDKLVVILPTDYEKSRPVWAAVKQLNKSEENLRKNREEEQRLGGLSPQHQYPSGAAQTTPGGGQRSQPVVESPVGVPVGPQVGPVTTPVPPISKTMNKVLAQPEAKGVAITATGGLVNDALAAGSNVAQQGESILLDNAIPELR